MNTSAVERHDRGVACPSVITLAVLLLGAGCASPPRTVHFYEGPERPPEELAAVDYAYPLEIVSIDGRVTERKRLHPMTQPRRLYLEPGTREVVARHGAIYLVDEEEPVVVRPEPVYLEVDLKAGRLYRLVHEIGSLQEGVDIRVEEVDRDE